MSDDDLRLIHVGVGSDHDPEFVWSQPQGLGYWSFLHFLTPSDILTENGRQVAQPGDCILIDTRFPNWHRGHRGRCVNDWCWVVGEAWDQWVADYALPVNRLVRPRQPGFVPILFTTIGEEYVRARPHWRRRIHQLAEEFLLTLARNLVDEGLPARPAQGDPLGDLRLRVLRSLDQPWTVADMASAVGLGANRFGVRYRQRFGCSPGEDLLRERIRHACLLLHTDGGGIADIARAVGFHDPSWFSRCFKARVGCSPRAYAQGR